MPRRGPWQRPLRDTPPCAAASCLPVKRDAHHRTAERCTLEPGSGLESIVEVSPPAEHVAPPERVADAAQGLPGEIGVACAGVHVERHEPLLSVAEGETTLG